MNASRMVVTPEPGVAVAGALVQAIRDHGGGFRIALSGGRTPEAMLRALGSPPHSERLLWNRIELFQVDERCVPPDHPDSNRGMIERCLLASLPERPVVHWVRTDLPPAQAGEEYAEDLARSLGDPPSLDLVLLGLGDDGHTASLFPGTSALAEERRLAVANLMDGLGSWRVTLTWRVLESARAAWFLVEGASKAEVVRRVLAERDPSLPATRLAHSGNAVWFVDAAAAGQLPAGLTEGGMAP